MKPAGLSRPCTKRAKAYKPSQKDQKLAHRVFHMTTHILLASGSQIRAQLLQQAGVDFSVEIARVDEDTIKSALLAEGASPRDIADALAEAKARKVSAKNPGALVLGCDQVLDFKGQLLSKPDSPEGL